MSSHQMTSSRRVVGVIVALLVLVASSPQCVAQGTAKDKPTAKSKPTPRGKAAPADATPGIRDYTSKNFLLHTDLSQQEAKELLTRLETMLAGISSYFGKPNAQVIEMNVVKDQNIWPVGSIHPDAIASIEGNAGITLSLTLGQRNGLGQTRITAAKSIVWAVADRGTPQHEGGVALIELRTTRERATASESSEKQCVCEVGSLKTLLLRSSGTLRR